jgi:hypothetical protein
MTEPQPSHNDPTPEERKGDSSFLPVVIAFAVAILVILVAAITFVKLRQTKAIPNPPERHPTSQLVLPRPTYASPNLSFATLPTSNRSLIGPPFLWVNSTHS